MTGLQLSISAESWPIAGQFTISRGAKREAEVLVATLSDATTRGRGECVPYARYGETLQGVRAAMLNLQDRLADGLTRQELQKVVPAGAARNALDCAFWDYEAKSSGTRAAELAGVAPLRPLTTAYTISLATPEEMAAKATSAAAHSLLKLKLGAAGDADRLAAVRAARPEARLIADANEGWGPQKVEGLLSACAEAGVELVEQPLPADRDGMLAEIDHPVPICADESMHTRADLSGLSARYDAINVKLDKTGGLTEALALVTEARAQGLAMMVGCMVATSLAMAPALLVAQKADFVDLDGPLLLARDRARPLTYEGSTVTGPDPALWG